MEYIYTGIHFITAKNDSHSTYIYQKMQTFYDSRRLLNFNKFDCMLQSCFIEIRNERHGCECAYGKKFAFPRTYKIRLIKIQTWYILCRK